MVIGLAAACALLMTGAAAAEPPRDKPGDESPGIQAITPSDAGGLAAAIAADPDAVTGAAFQTTTGGSPNAVADSGTPLGGFPTDGSTYAILTSGNATQAGAGDQTFFASTSNGGGAVRGGAERDVTVLGIDLDVPAVANCLTIDFRFLSEEFPEYVGGSVSDSFVAELDVTNWTRRFLRHRRPTTSPSTPRATWSASTRRA